MFKSSCRQFFAVMLSLAAASASAETDGRAGVYGFWESEKGTVFSISEKDGLLQAEVVAMRKPRLDKKNPDTQLRTRPVIGLQVLSDYEFKRGTWRGRIYDPGSGNSFKSYIKRGDDGDLRLRGYVGFSLFGKTEIFRSLTADAQARLGATTDSQPDPLAGRSVDARCVRAR
jgi:uncharacterized protein (DUF2147 family)